MEMDSHNVSQDARAADDFHHQSTPSADNLLPGQRDTSAAQPVHLHVSTTNNTPSHKSYDATYPPSTSGYQAAPTGQWTLGQPTHNEATAPLATIRQGNQPSITINQAGQVMQDDPQYAQGTGPLPANTWQ
eukprot:gene4702-4885_t